MQLPICEICEQTIFGKTIQDKDGSLICEECDNEQKLINQK